VQWREPQRRPPAPAEAKLSPEEEDEQRAAKQDRQLEQSRIADEKRKADQKRKKEEIDRLANQADEERQAEVARIALEKKRREELARQQAQVEQRCKLKPVMTDTEIARCRNN
jgi:ATP-dependent DNA ligase